MVLSVCFGLAPNYYLALFIRTFWGFTNGNLGVLKTYVSEMCSEDKQSLGFSIIVTMGGISKYTHSEQSTIVLLVLVLVVSLEMPIPISLHWFEVILGFEMYSWVRSFILVSSVSPMSDWEPIVGFHSHHGDICIKGKSNS